MTPFHLNTFTPAQAEAITGVTTTMQRDWRRPERGFLKKTEGHARYDCYDLAQMAVMKALSERGVGPQASESVANNCAAGVCFHLLMKRERYEGDFDDVLLWWPEEMLDPVESDPAESPCFAYESGNPRSVGLTPAKMADDDSPRVRQQVNWLKQQITVAKGYAQVFPWRYLIWWADDSHVWTEDIQASFDNREADDPRKHGPVIVIDLISIAAQMARAIDRPLAKISFERDPQLGPVRPEGLPVLLMEKRLMEAAMPREASLPRGDA